MLVSLQLKNRKKQIVLFSCALISPSENAHDAHFKISILLDPYSRNPHSADPHFPTPGPRRFPGTPIPISLTSPSPRTPISVKPPSRGCPVPALTAAPSPPPGGAAALAPAGVCARLSPPPPPRARARAYRRRSPRPAPSPRTRAAVGRCRSADEQDGGALRVPGGRRGRAGVAVGPASRCE